MSNDAQAPDATVEPQKSNVPTEPGWYRWQQISSEQPEAIEVRVGQWARMWAYRTNMTKRNSIGHMTQNGRWSDRIQPPADMVGGAE